MASASEESSSEQEVPVPAKEPAEEVPREEKKEKDKPRKDSDKKETEKKVKEKSKEKSKKDRASRSHSPRKSKADKRRSRSRRDRDRGRSRHRERGRDGRSRDKEEDRPDRRAVRNSGSDPPPEPADPPKSSGWQVVHAPGGSTRGASKGKGKDAKAKKWTCKDCGSKTAPYGSAMEQHRWTGEQCLAWQRWNKLSTTEQTQEEWERCLEYAQRLRLTRRTDVVDASAERGASPALTVASSRKGRGQKPGDEMAKPEEKKKVKKKSQRSEESSSGDRPVRPKQHRRKGSSSSEHGRRMRRDGRDGKKVVINIA